MELFEILFILFFILIPIIEGIRKSRQRPDVEDQAPAPPQARRPHEPERDTGEASDMLPDDLWEVLTGERRERPAPAEDSVETEEEYETWRDERDVADEPWYDEPAWQAEEEPAEEERFEPAPWMEDEPAPGWAEPDRSEPASTHAEPPPSPPSHGLGSLGTLGDAIGEPRARRQGSPLMASLRSTHGLRQAVLLREILGPPKGLDS